MLNIYNTLTRQKEPFAPIDPKNVRMYVCGMTVYDYCHLGHARVMVVFDMIARWLRECGYPLTYVRNITDIDDKIIARAAENGETIGELTARFIQAMHEDADALGVLRPDIEPKATENIPQMIAMIETLIQNGKAYPAANGDVYYAVREFSVSLDASYTLSFSGCLSLYRLYYREGFDDGWFDSLWSNRGPRAQSQQEFCGAGAQV